MIQFREIIIAVFESMAADTPYDNSAKVNSRKDPGLKILQPQDTERLRILTSRKISGAGLGSSFPFRCKLADPNL